MTLLRSLLRSGLQFGAQFFLIRRKLVYEIGVDELRPAEPRIPAHFRTGNHDDLLRLSERAHDYDNPAREFALERMESGDLLTIAEAENNIVFYSWLMFGQLDMSVRRFLPLSADTAYLYRLFTVESYRGRRLSAAYFWYLRDQLGGRHVRRIVSWVEARNKISRRAFENAGFRHIGNIWHCRLLFGNFFLVSSSLREKLSSQSSGAASSTVMAKGAQA